MSRYFIGVDVGGSKSHALLADEQGRVLGFGQGGPGNHETIGFGGFSETLHRVIDQALKSAGVSKESIAGCGFGVAGFDWPSDRPPHEQVIQTLGFSAPFGLVNDAVIGLIAGAESGWGISIVAGTGNNCRGRDAQGREGRVVGTGYWSGEHGGGHDLALHGMEAVCRAWIKRSPETVLTQKFMEHLGANDIDDMLEGLSRGRYELGSHSGMVVFEAAEQGDAVAIEVIRWMGNELGSLGVGVARQLGFESLEFEVVLTGSLHKGSPIILEGIRETIHAVAPGARFVRLQAAPVVGAVLLGMEQVGLRSPDVRKALMVGASQLVYGQESALQDNV